MALTRAAALTDVSIVMLSHNRLPELMDNLESRVADLIDAGAEVIVVDNASTDGSAEFLRELSKRASMKLILNATNTGVSLGREVGWRASTRCYILNVDDDTRVTTDVAIKLRRVLDVDSSVGVAFPAVHHPDGRVQTPLTPDPHSTFHGACFMVRRIAYEEVGSQDPDCRFGGEELDYSIRMRARGWAVRYWPDAVVEHNSLRRSGTETIRRRVEWTESYVRVLFRHFPPNMAAILSLRMCASQFVGALRASGPRGALAVTLAALRGLWAGRRCHDRAPERVTRLYSNRDLLPDYGNVPIRRKVSRSLRNRGLGRLARRA